MSSIDELDSCFEKLGGSPLWVRSKNGAGGNLSLLCTNSEEAKHWINLWIMRQKAQLGDFMIQEYLPGQNIAWDSFWFNGKLIASYTRERIEYPFKHISPSGITGTPTVSKIVVNEKEYLTGTFKDINDDGSLILEKKNKLISIYSGRIEL